MQRDGIFQVFNCLFNRISKLGNVHIDTLGNIIISFFANKVFIIVYRSICKQISVKEKLEPSYATQRDI